MKNKKDFFCDHKVVPTGELETEGEFEGMPIEICLRCGKEFVKLEIKSSD